MKLLRASIPANIELRQNLTADDNPVFADPKELQQIVIHLVTNAAQAMQTGGGTIDVNLSFFTAENAEPELPAAMKNRAYFKLTVRDTGPGIDVDTTRRLFDPFFTTKGPGGGKGEPFG